jgi:acyl-CoA dehydrogenase
MRGASGTAASDDAQQRDMDFTLALGELFTLVVYGHLILEQADIIELEDDVLDTVFDVLVRDFSAGAVDLHGKRSSTEAQQRWALSAVRKPATDPERFDRTWQQVVSLSGTYEMNP